MRAPRPVVLLVACLAGLASGSCRSPPRSTPAPRSTALPTGPHAEGLTHLAAGRLAEAIGSLSQAVRLDPRSAAAHRDLGAALQRAGDAAVAMEATAAAVRLDASDADAWIQLGSLHYARRDSAQAEAAFRRGLELRPDRADAHDWLGSALFAQHAAALGGDNVDRGRVAAAIAAFEEATRRDPGQPDYALRLGLARRKAHDLEGAVRDFERAVAIGGRPECRMHLAEALLERGDVARAEAELVTALRAKPTMARALTDLGRIRLGLGDLEGARELLDRAVELEPANPEPRLPLAATLRRLGLDAQAEEHDAAFARLHSASEDMRSALAAVTRRPDDPAAHQALGQVREASGDLQGAAESYARVIELDPGAVAARVNLGGLLLDAGRPEAALPHLRAAAEADPTLPQVHVNLGLALLRLGDVEGARAAYHEALRRAPGDASIVARLEGLPATLTSRTSP